MAAFDDVVIISGCRTPVGKFQGSLSDLSATQLGAIVVREAVKRANVDPKLVDECIMGNVVSAGLGQNPGRQAAIYGGLCVGERDLRTLRYALGPDYIIRSGRHGRLRPAKQQPALAF